MAALQVERTPSLAEEDIVIFEDAVARQDGDAYVINGSKTFITNGQTANLILVVCKTDPTQGARGTSLLVVETDNAPGFERGRNLDKLGMEAADTSELFFNDVRVPTSNLLGEGEGHGFRRAETIIKTLEGELYFYGRIFGFTPAGNPTPLKIENLTEH